MGRLRVTARAEATGEVAEEQGGGPHPEPGPARRLLVAVFALILAAAGIAFAFSALGPDPRPAADVSPSPSASSVPPLTGDPVITAEIPLVEEGGRGGIGGVAVGAGSAWVGVQRGGTSSVARIDLATNEVLAEIPVRGTPWRKRIAATDEAVWAASTGTLERIDPATNAVIAKVDLQGRPVSAIAADSNAVWAVAITEPTDEGGEWTGTLVRVDPATNEVVAEIALGSQVAGYEDEVMLGAGSVWVLGVRWFEREDAEYGSDLIRVDPTTNTIAARIPVGGFHMAMGADEVWVRFPADGVFDTSGESWLWTRVDIRTNEPSEPFEFDDHGLRLVTPEALWSVGYDEQQSVQVIRFDPETLEVAVRSEPIPSLFHTAVIDPASTTVWVSAVWNLVRLDIVDEDVSMSPSPGATSSSDGSSEASVTTFEPSQDWNLVLTIIDPNNPQDLPIAWAANVPFSPNESASGFPTETIRDLPSDGIVITVVGPREYTGDSVFPPATFPMTISQGFCSYDEYETQPAPHVSKCLVDTMVGDELMNVTVWFGTNRPSDDMYQEANNQLARLVLPGNAEHA
jgi:hypothetical protein